MGGGVSQYKGASLRFLIVKGFLMQNDVEFKKGVVPSEQQSCFCRRGPSGKFWNWKPLYGIYSVCSVYHKTIIRTMKLSVYSSAVKSKCRLNDFRNSMVLILPSVWKGKGSRVGKAPKWIDRFIWWRSPDSYNSCSVLSRTTKLCEYRGKVVGKMLVSKIKVRTPLWLIKDHLPNLHDWHDC